MSLSLQDIIILCSFGEEKRDYINGGWCVWARTFVNGSKIRCSSALFLGNVFYDVPNPNPGDAVQNNLEIWRENSIFELDMSWNNDKCCDWVDFDA